MEKLIKRDTVVVKHSSSNRLHDYFIDYTISDGSHVYVVNERLVSKDEGNALYLIFSKEDKCIARRLPTEWVDVDKESDYYFSMVDDDISCADGDLGSYRKIAARNKDLCNIIDALHGRSQVYGFTDPVGGYHKNYKGWSPSGHYCDECYAQTCENCATALKWRGR